MVECDKALLGEVFETLSSRQKEVWELFNEGLSQAKIARRLGVSNTRIYDIKKKIRWRIRQAKQWDKWKEIARY